MMDDEFEIFGTNPLWPNQSTIPESGTEENQGEISQDSRCSACGYDKSVSRI
jgi:hypothetical protein